MDRGAFRIIAVPRIVPVLGLEPLELPERDFLGRDGNRSIDPAIVQGWASRRIRPCPAANPSGIRAGQSERRTYARSGPRSSGGRDCLKQSFAALRAIAFSSPAPPSARGAIRRPSERPDQGLRDRESAFAQERSPSHFRRGPRDASRPRPEGSPAAQPARRAAAIACPRESGVFKAPAASRSINSDRRRGSLRCRSNRQSDSGSPRAARAIPAEAWRPASASLPASSSGSATRSSSTRRSASSAAGVGPSRTSSPSTTRDASGVASAVNWASALRLLSRARMTASASAAVDWAVASRPRSQQICSSGGSSACGNAGPAAQSSATARAAARR